MGRCSSNPEDCESHPVTAGCYPRGRRRNGGQAKSVGWVAPRVRRHKKVKGDQSLQSTHVYTIVHSIISNDNPFLVPFKKSSKWAWPASLKDYELQIDDPNNPLSVFAAVWSCARDMEKPDAHQKWRSACGQIVSATRKAEELLQPLLRVEVFPAESDVFTHPTDPSHSQAPLQGSVTAETWSKTEETRAQGGAEASQLPDVIAGGEIEAKMQAIEHTLLELQNLYDRDHPRIAFLLHALGNLSQQAGDLKQAKQYFDESLRMKRSLHADRDHPGIAATLHELGTLNEQAGDLKQAKQYLDESLRMKRSLHGDRDHPGIAAILHTLGNLSQQAGDLKQAKQYFDESLRMKRSLHGDRDHPDIAATLHALGNLSQRAGDLKQAKQYLDESLRMKRSLHGDRDHPDLLRHCMH